MKTIEEIIEDIGNFFGDTSRSQAETRAGLEQIAGECEVLLESLPEDDESDEG
ncbi:hypothetical protein [Bradyrhizobium yuanmingense]|uniref:hypothetical protein n=1 Tax=Bradyrhizobium yuanmingense TaxID=108015 RepID=UPI0004B07E99|nr:hypothetical protein [Bradyrhizobium yuanmingense]